MIDDRSSTSVTQLSSSRHPQSQYSKIPTQSMYSTCLLCADSLGTNAVLETLPVGRRLAFDPAKGRLWVVCPGCARWNLVPFDNRLEAIDECERCFRDTRVRFSTGTIGMARMPDGTELVRIGEALRPEFAAWRYGRELLRRRRRPWGRGRRRWACSPAPEKGPKGRCRSRPGLRPRGCRPACPARRRSRSWQR